MGGDATLSMMVIPSSCIFISLDCEPQVQKEGQKWSYFLEAVGKQMAVRRHKERWEPKESLTSASQGRELMEEEVAKRLYCYTKGLANKAWPFFDLAILRWVIRFIWEIFGWWSRVMESEDKIKKWRKYMSNTLWSIAATQHEFAWIFIEVKWQNRQNSYSKSGSAAVILNMWYRCSKLLHFYV